MLPEERIRLLIFVVAVLTVYALAGGILIGALVRWVRGIPTPVGAFQRWFSRSVFSLAVIGFVCIGYGYFVEPYWPQVNHVRLESTKLAPGTGPIRIVHISDFHSDPKVRLERQLPEIIAAEEPDLIVFTGDTINSPEGLPNARAALMALAKIAPTYAVKGNWDVWFWSVEALFGGTGVVELNGQSVCHPAGGTDIWIGGIAVGNENRLTPMLDEMPPRSFKVLAYHYPDEAPLASSQGADLYLAGHTHGGQVALPFYGALITLSRLGKRYEAGLYRERDMWLYVNRGIGMEGGPAPRVRFWARPEITVIDLHPAPPRPTVTAEAVVPPDSKRVGSSIRVPRPIKRVMPEYPPGASRLVGDVVLELDIDESGSVQTINVIKGHPILVEAARKAAIQWKYEPLLLDGEAKPFTATLEVRFRNKGEPQNSGC